MNTISGALLYGTAIKGEHVWIGIIVDAKDIQGIDIDLDISPKLKAIRLAVSELLPITMGTSIQDHRILFGQVIQPGSAPWTGKGLLAVIEAECLATGTAAIKFKFKKGDTTDTNLASNGLDVLTKVTNKSLKII